jgi:hypothetical protein
VRGTGYNTVAGMGINNVKPVDPAAPAAVTLREDGHKVTRPAAAAFHADFAFMRLLEVRPGFEGTLRRGL